MLTRRQAIAATIAAVAVPMLPKQAVADGSALVDSSYPGAESLTIDSVSMYPAGPVWTFQAWNGKAWEDITAPTRERTVKVNRRTKPGEAYRMLISEPVQESRLSTVSFKAA